MYSMTALMPATIAHHQSGGNLLKGRSRLSLYSTIWIRFSNNHLDTCPISNGFRSGQNRYPTENRPTFVCSPVGWVLEHGQAESSRSYFSQVSEKSQSDTRVTQDRPGFYY